jgi:hypothetical protein
LPVGTACLWRLLFMLGSVPDTGHRVKGFLCPSDI